VFLALEERPVGHAPRGRAAVRSYLGRGPLPDGIGVDPATVFRRVAAGAERASSRLQAHRHIRRRHSGG